MGDFHGSAVKNGFKEVSLGKKGQQRFLRELWLVFLSHHTRMSICLVLVGSFHGSAVKHGFKGVSLGCGCSY